MYYRKIFFSLLPQSQLNTSIMFSLPQEFFLISHCFFFKMTHSCHLDALELKKKKGPKGQKFRTSVVGEDGVLAISVGGHNGKLLCMGKIISIFWSLPQIPAFSSASGMATFNRWNVRLSICHCMYLNAINSGKLEWKYLLAPCSPLFKISAYKF